jgi:hypothetical protein
MSAIWLVRVRARARGRAGPACRPPPLARRGVRPRALATSPRFSFGPPRRGLGAHTPEQCGTTRGREKQEETPARTGWRRRRLPLLSVSFTLFRKCLTPKSAN